MKLRLFTFLVLATSSFAADISYLAKMIACESKEELKFPARLAIRNGVGFILSRSFYVSPNELRGFELFVPKDCIVENEGVLISTAALIIDREETKQGIRCLVLKKSPTSR